jgi:hypothetical protein
MRMFILPNPISQKLNFPAQVDLTEEHQEYTTMPKRSDTLFVESVAYQEALPQMLEMHGITAEAIKAKRETSERGSH